MTELQNDVLVGLITKQRSELQRRIVAAELAHYASMGVAASHEMEASISSHVDGGLDFVTQWMAAPSMNESHAFFAGMLARNRQLGVAPEQVLRLVDLVTGIIADVAREQLRGVALNGVLRRLEQGAVIGKAVLTGEAAKLDKVARYQPPEQSH